MNNDKYEILTWMFATMWFLSILALVFDVWELSMFGLFTSVLLFGRKLL